MVSSVRSSPLSSPGRIVPPPARPSDMSRPWLHPLPSHDPVPLPPSATVQAPHDEADEGDLELVSFPSLLRASSFPSPSLDRARCYTHFEGLGLMETRDEVSVVYVEQRQGGREGTYGSLEGSKLSRGKAGQAHKSCSTPCHGTPRTSTPQKANLASASHLPSDDHRLFSRKAQQPAHRLGLAPQWHMWSSATQHTPWPTSPCLSSSSTFRPPFLLPSSHLPVLLFARVSSVHRRGRSPLPITEEVGLVVCKASPSHPHTVPLFPLPPIVSPSKRGSSQCS